LEGLRRVAEFSTSYVERHNLSMRMGMRRFTRLTNAFSKKVDNHAAAVSLNMMWMNVGRPHRSLANPYARTPAMAAGVANHVWTCEEIAALLDLAAGPCRVLRIVIGPVLHELTSRRLRKRHLRMYFRHVTHRGLN